MLRDPLSKPSPPFHQMFSELDDSRCRVRRRSRQWHDLATVLDTFYLGQSDTYMRALWCLRVEVDPLNRAVFDPPMDRHFADAPTLR